MRLDLFTDPLADGRIFQTLKAVQGEPSQETATVIGRWVADTREEAIKKALIELGWTPPGQKDYREICLAYGGDCGQGEKCSMGCFES